MLDYETLEMPANTVEAPDRRRPGRDDAAPALIPLLRHAADAVDMPQSQHGVAWPEFSRALDDLEPARLPLPTDGRSERSLIIQIVATVCVICLAVAALSS